LIQRRFLVLWLQEEDAAVKVGDSGGVRFSERRGEAWISVPKSERLPELQTPYLDQLVRETSLGIQARASAYGPGNPF